MKYLSKGHLKMLQSAIGEIECVAVLLQDELDLQGRLEAAKTLVVQVAIEIEDRLNEKEEGK